MKLKNTNDIKLETRNNKTIDAKIDTKALGLVMDMLAKNYNNPLGSAIREYVSNGIDANKEANSTKPVEITLPNSFNNEEIVIKDYGTGLSFEEIVNIYANFGTSTKRDSDELIGGFGIGSKSGLAISNMITITSVKDSLKNIFTLVRDESGISTIILKQDEPTTDENGTTIQIPFHMLDDYEKENIQTTISGWSKNEVVVNGNNADYNDYRIPDNATKCEFGWILDNNKNLKLKSDHTLNDYINYVVSGVAYPSHNIYHLMKELPDDEKEKVENYKSIVSKLVIDLPIEEADVSYSRETINDTTQMRQICAAYLVKMVDALEEHIKDILKDVKTIQDAMRLLAEKGFIKNYNLSQIKWNEKTIRDHIYDYESSLTHKEMHNKVNIVNKRCTIKSPFESEPYLSSIYKNSKPIIISNEPKLTPAQKTKIRTLVNAINAEGENGLDDKVIQSLSDNMKNCIDYIKRYTNFTIVNTPNVDNYIYKEDIIYIDELLAIAPKKKDTKTQNTVDIKNARAYVYYPYRNQKTQTSTERIKKGDYVALKKNITELEDKILSQNLFVNLNALIPHKGLNIVVTKKAYDYLINEIGCIPITDDNYKIMFTETYNKDRQIIEYATLENNTLIDLLVRLRDDELPDILEYIGVDKALCSKADVISNIRYELKRYVKTITYSQTKEYTKDYPEFPITKKTIIPELNMINSWDWRIKTEDVKTFLSLFKNKFPQMKEFIETIIKKGDNNND